MTNLALISPDTRLRVFRDMMPHELASIEVRLDTEAEGEPERGRKNQRGTESARARKRERGREVSAEWQPTL